MRRLTGKGLVLLTLSCVSCSHFAAPTVKSLVSHQGFDWKSAETEHLRFYFESDSFAERHIDALETSGEAGWSRIMSLLGEATYPDPVTVFALESRARMRALIGKETNGQALPDRNIVLFVFSDQIDASGAHELSHVLARNLWGNADDWINEGLAAYADDSWQQRPLHIVAAYLRQQGTLVPLADLLRQFNKHDALVTYPESGSFVKFLYERYGRAAVREIWTGGAAAIPRATGKSVSELEQEWRKFTT